MEFVNAFDKLSKLIKFILTFFLGVILGGVYRILKGRVIVGILWILTAGFFGIGVVIDLVTVLLDNKYTVLV
ncbi:MAG TPA: NINE protein [Acholeplasmatales bacterium]|nr:NINE protein [Acholeplasmatales bacterium]